MELEALKQEFAQQGLGIAAVSHDTPAILREFAEKKHITIPLLSDEHSEAIRAFGVMNPNVPADSPNYGMAFPGQFVVNHDGVVMSKYFEENHRERVTMESVLVRDFDWRPGKQGLVETDAVVIEYAGSAPVIRPGNHMTLVLDVTLQPGMHVYAPGVEGGYRPVAWTLLPSSIYRGASPEFPPGEHFVQEFLGDTVLVYRKSFRILQDVEIADRKYLEAGLGGISDSTELTIEGEFEYQACNDEVCLLPHQVALKFTFRVEQHDWERTEARRPAPTQ